MKKPIYQKTLKVGKHGNGKRITLWHKSMIAAGFDFGTKITLKRVKTQSATPFGSVALNGFKIVPDDDGKRTVASVINHGTRLPVIDIKGKILDELTATHVEVKFVDNLITIREAN